MANPFGTGANQSYANPLKAALHGQIPNRPNQSRGGSGGRGNRGGNQLELSNEENLRRDAEERARREAERVSLAQQAAADKARQEKIASQTLTGQLNKDKGYGAFVGEKGFKSGFVTSTGKFYPTANKNFVPQGYTSGSISNFDRKTGSFTLMAPVGYGQMTEQEAPQSTGSQQSLFLSDGLIEGASARENLLQMSIAQPKTKLGMLVGGIQSRETFIQSRFEENLIAQGQEFKSMTQEDLFAASGRQGSGVVGMSTDRGSIFSFEYDEKKARREAEISFANLPASQRFKLLGGSALAGGLKGVASTAEFTLDVPLRLLPGDVKTGKRVSSDTLFNRIEAFREVKNLPGGGATTGFEIAAGAGLLVRAGSGVLRGTSGFTRAERLREAAFLFAPIRPSGKVYAPSENTFKGEIGQLGIEGKTTVTVFKGRGATFNDVEVVSIGIKPRGAVTETATAVTGPVYQFRGGRLIEGKQSVLSLGRTTSIKDTEAFMQLGTRGSLKQTIFYKPTTYGDAKVSKMFGSGTTTASLDLPILRITQFGNAKPIVSRVDSSLSISGLTSGETVRASFEGNTLYGRTKIESGIFGVGVGASPYKPSIFGKFTRITRFSESSPLESDRGFSTIARGKRGRRTTAVVQEQSVIAAQTTEPLKQISSSVTATSKALSTSYSVKQSQYYGLGLYEKTEGMQAQILTRQRTSTLTSNVFGLSQINFKQLQYQRLPQGIMPRQMPRQSQLQSQRLLQGQLAMQGQAQSQLQSQRLLQGYGLGTSYVRYPGPRIPYRITIPFGGFVMGLASNRGKSSLLGGSFAKSYTASFTSSSFRIFGKVPTRFKGGQTNPFSRRVIPLFGRRKKRKK